MADVEWAREGHVQVVTINRPERRNAIGGSVLRLLKEAFTEAAEDDRVRAVVTTGAGTDFCVGADVSTLESISSDPPPADGSKPNRGGNDNGLRAPRPSEVLLDRIGPGHWMSAMLELPKPTVAAVNGAAAGGGLAVAVVHDFRVAAATARFVPGFVALGLVPEMGLTKTLPQLIGASAARRMLVLNERITAARAVEIGLADAVSEADVVADAVAFAERLAALPPLAVQATLRLLAGRRPGWRQTLEAEYSTQRILFASQDHRSAIGAFLTGAPAAYHGR